MKNKLLLHADDISESDGWMVHLSLRFLQSYRISLACLIKRFPLNNYVFFRNKVSRPPLPPIVLKIEFLSLDFIVASDSSKNWSMSKPLNKTYCNVSFRNHDATSNRTKSINLGQRVICKYEHVTVCSNTQLCYIAKLSWKLFYTSRTANSFLMK